MNFFGLKGSKKKERKIKYENGLKSSDKRNDFNLHINYI